MIITDSQNLGNFSFSKALADILHRADNFTCTAFDSKETALTKYPEAQENLVALNDMEAEILFQVDATNLIKTPELKGRLYDKIVFNFPHVGLGIKDQEKNVKANQNMILLFLEHASKKLRKGGKIFVSLKTGLPYDLWDIKALGKAAGLALNRSCEFVASDYPGYAHRRTIGFQEFISSSNNEEINKKNPRMYIFSNSD